MKSFQPISYKSSCYRLVKGFAMIEILVGLSIAAVFAVGFMALILQSARISRANTTELAATLYVREVIEVLKDMERSDWPALVSSPCFAPLECHMAPAGSTWTITNLPAPAETLEDNYTRSISLSPVYRDTVTDEIVPMPGVPDPDTLKAVVFITWNSGITNRALTLETYIYNLP